MNKMAGMVLQKLRAANEGAFMSAALRLPDPVSKETLSAKPSDANRLVVSQRFRRGGGRAGGMLL